VSHDEGPLAHLFDTARFEQLQRVANAMAFSTFLPAHLKTGTKEETVSNCLRVLNQAFRWGMDPFAVVDETYVVRGKLAYQGKLVAAIVNAKANLTERLKFSFAGSGDKRTVTVSGTFTGEQEPRTVEVELGKVKTDNQMWAKDPDQKLCYNGAIKWARRHCPELILGVITEDDPIPQADDPQPATKETGRLSVRKNGHATVNRIAGALPAEPEKQPEIEAEPEIVPELPTAPDENLDAEDCLNDITGKLKLCMSVRELKKAGEYIVESTERLGGPESRYYKRASEEFTRASVDLKAIGVTLPVKASK
jgi:hypothetical protein